MGTLDRMGNEFYRTAISLATETAAIPGIAKCASAFP